MYKKIKLLVILRGGYAYSRGYVYCFCQMFQGLRLFKGVRLFRSLEYSIEASADIYILLYIHMYISWWVYFVTGLIYVLQQPPTALPNWPKQRQILQTRALNPARLVVPHENDNNADQEFSDGWLKKLLNVLTTRTNAFFNKVINEHCG